jgi:hypothetical protein
MKPDMVISWEHHLKNGNVWQVEVELAMQGGDSDEQLVYTVEVYVVAPNQALAQYIVATMYPEYASLSVADEPCGISDFTEELHS